MSANEIQNQNKPPPTGEEDPNHKKMVSSSSPNNNPTPYELLEEGSKPATIVKETKSNKLTLIPLIFLIYFEVSGGPFAEEPAVKAAGPLYAILGFLIFPFIWSIPEALITAELATAYPGNGGYVIWANEAFGPFWGFQMGSQKFLSGVINNAAYPVLCVDYLKLVFKAFEKGWPRNLAISASTLLLSVLNYTGITVVGYTAVVLGVVSLCPFLLMSCISIPKLHPRRWLSTGQPGVKKDWPLYFNTLFWNLNFWDNASTLAGEVENPQKTFPKALFSSGILTVLGYIVPLLAVTGSLSVDQNKWEDGFLADAAGMIAGDWLKFWVEVGAVLSAIGLFQAQLSSCSYQLLGMADLGFLPKVFGLRSKWFNTPWVGILLCSMMTLGVSYMDFTDIISSANFLYSLSMLLEFATFLWLRKKRPNLNRPYKVPLGIPALIVMSLIPIGFLIFVMVIAEDLVKKIGAALTAGGVVIFGLVQLCKSQSWFEFNEYKKDDDEK